jgi:uncharacterized lipoprotein YmbA
MRRSLVLLVLIAALVGLTACSSSSSKASTTTRSTPSSVPKPKAKGNPQRARQRLAAYLTCLKLHGVVFKSGTKNLTAAELRAEPKYVTAVTVCKVRNQVTPTTAKAG